MKEKLIAWILSLVVAAGGTGCAIDPGQGTQSPMDIFDSAYAMETPVFPQMAAYPEMGDGSGYDPAAWEEWSAQKQKQWEAAAAYEGKLDHYLQTAVPALLTPQKGSVNAVCSPVNVWFALAMAAETAAGDTRKELLDLLGVSTVEELRTIAGNLWTANYTDDGANTCRLGASLWMDQNIEFKEKTLQTLAKDYFAASFRGEMTDPAFSRAFKDWLNEMTGGLLEGNIEQMDDFNPDNIMALATTVYFSAKWDNEFSEDKTFPETFHGTKKDADVDFLHSGREGTYYWEDNFGAVQLPFTEAGSMWIILPDEGTAPEELLASGEVLSFLAKDYGERNGKSLIIDLALPKFDLTSSQDLKETLMSLGITRMFTGAADFSNLTDEEGVYVSSAQHDARVKINEEGCEAAAFTVMMYAKSAMPPDERMEFRVDRPFLFVVTGIDGLPLFMGLVNQIG
jgi:serine protease inhibitor